MFDWSYLFYLGQILDKCPVQYKFFELKENKIKLKTNSEDCDEQKQNKKNHLSFKNNKLF